MEIFDVVIRALAVFGLPGALIYFVRDRRHNNIRDRELEQKTPFEVRATAATTLDGEVVALQKAFDAGNNARNDTIKYLTVELAASRLREAEQVERNTQLQAQADALQERVRELQAKVTDLQETLTGVSEELEAIRYLAHDPAVELVDPHSAT